MLAGGTPSRSASSRFDSGLAAMLSSSSAPTTRATARERSFDADSFLALATDASPFRYQG
ncbi:MAG: hypothetical protein U1F11_05405 [Steroidobacteraceae bacterium]